MSSSTILKRWKWIALASLVQAVALIGPKAGAEKITVPRDSSLSIAEYVELGVPHPSHEWSANEYIQALHALGKIPREELPRAGSSQSQLLFDRLLLSYARAFDLSYDSSKAEASGDSLPESLPELYSTAHEDRLLFDRELVAIRSKTLLRSLETLPTRAQLSALASQFAERIGSAISEVDRREITDRVAKAEAAAARTSDQIKRQVSELLAIAGMPEIEDPARFELVKNAEGLFPELPKFLPDDDLRWIATLLRGAASPDFNAVIRPALLKLAEQLEADDART